MRIEIYKKHLAEIKKINKSNEWTELGKKVFASQIDEFIKYKIMIILSQFKFVRIEQEIYYYATPLVYGNYIRFYEGLIGQLENVKIKLVVNK